MDTTDLNKVLHYGYMPDCRSSLPTPIANAAECQDISGNHQTLLQIGKEALRKAVNRQITAVGTDCEHIVPLSGGLDSRAILAYLLDHNHVDKSQISTVTIGCPGTYDFEYGQEVAAAAGVTNEVINLNSASFDWSIETLRRFSSSDYYCSPGRVFDKYIVSRVFNFGGGDAVYWSGFMGDPPAGSHLPATMAEEWDMAVNWFTEYERYTSDARVVAQNWNPSEVLPSSPYISKRRLCFELQLDFTHRQYCLINEIVQSSRCNTPFLEPCWLEFILNVPHKYREGRQIFGDILIDEFPKLFSIPTDANNGLPINAGGMSRLIQHSKQKIIELFHKISNNEYDPSMNYIDFESELRSGGCLYSQASTLIDDFNRRDIVDWFNPRAVWQDHQAGDDLSHEIVSICSVELFLDS